MMKKLLLISLLIPSITFAQDGIKRIINNEKNGTPKIIVLEDGNHLTESEALNFLSNYLKLQPNESFKEIMRKDYDSRGYIKYVHTIDGIDVFGDVYTAHIKNGYVNKFSGNFNSNITPQSVALSKEQAIAEALGYFGAEKYYWESEIQERLLQEQKDNPSATHYPNPKLVYNTLSGNSLCYELDVYALVPDKAEKIFVDANTGKIVKTISLLHDADKEAVGVSNFSDTVTIMTYQDTSGLYSLRDFTRGGGILTYDVNESTDYADTVNFIHGDTVWDITNASRDEVAIDAHWGAEMTYDYFMQKHGRDSYDGNGSKLLSLVHFDQNWSNASWNGFSMRYGDGSSGGNPYLSIDIVGHEIAHGVTGNSAGLIYQGESGALNESFSDIFGNAIEYFTDSSKATWYVGEQCFNTLRNMQNPNEFGDPDTYMGSYWTDTESSFDNGGVHINSGVQNKWFQLLVEGGTGVNDNGDSYDVKSMGWEIASEIAYRNLNEYLTQSSTFRDARDYSYEIAADMFGDCSADAFNVIEAWYAVGVGERMNESLEADFLVNYSYTCNLPLTINFKNLTGNSDAFYKWELSSGVSSSDIDFSYTFEEEGEYTITLTADYSNSCFTNLSDITKTLELIELGSPDSVQCEPEVSYQSSTIGINRVMINGLDFESGLNDEDYNDYTCESNTVLHIDSIYEMTILTSPGTKENARVWIDFNNDGDFTDEELIFKSDAQYETHTSTVSFEGLENEPIFKKPIRMRVISDILFNSEISACGDLQYGQTEDYSVVMVRKEGNLSVKEDLTGKLSVYPNPSSSHFTVELSGNEKLTRIELVDMAGKVVLTETHSMVNISDIPDGIYFVRAYSAENIYSSKIIKK